jgi:Ca2+-binding EF-hand superfamily protein
MKEINDKLGYGYSETELLDILHAVGGYNHETITFEKFNSYIRRKVVKRKQEIAAQR